MFGVFLSANGGGIGRRERKTLYSKFCTVLITFHPRCKRKMSSHCSCVVWPITYCKILHIRSVPVGKIGAQQSDWSPVRRVKTIPLLKAKESKTVNPNKKQNLKPKPNRYPKHSKNLNKIPLEGHHSQAYPEEQQNTTPVPLTEKALAGLTIIKGQNRRNMRKKSHKKQQ